jgi:hypothetical protein
MSISATPLVIWLLGIEQDEVDLIDYKKSGTSTIKVIYQGD